MSKKKITISVSLLFLILICIVYFFTTSNNNVCIGCRANTPCALAYDCENFSDNTLKCTHINEHDVEEFIICDIVND